MTVESLKRLLEVCHTKRDFEQEIAKGVAGKEVLLDHAVAVAHRTDRLEDASKRFFAQKGWIAEGYITKELYTPAELHVLRAEAPGALKRVGAVVYGKRPAQYRFVPKYNGDKWKKIVQDGSIEGVMEFETFDLKADGKALEGRLRDRVRSCKEIPSLKPLPFVWIGWGDERVAHLARFYFPNGHHIIALEGAVVAMGWSQTLAGINMRNFLYDPN